MNSCQSGRKLIFARIVAMNSFDTFVCEVEMYWGDRSRS